MKCPYQDGFCAFSSWDPQQKHYDCGPYGIPDGANCKGRIEQRKKVLEVDRGILRRVR